MASDWLSQLGQRAPQIALAFLAAKQGGPQAVAAFQQGLMESQQYHEAKARQAQMDDERRQLQASQETRAQSAEMRAQSADARAAEATRLNRLQSALGLLDQHATQLGETATDPAAAENALLGRATSLEHSFGIPQGQLSPFVPPMAPTISRRQKKTAQDLYDRAEKLYGPEAMANDQITLKTEAFGDVKPSHLRGMFAPQATMPTGEPVPPMVPTARPETRSLDVQAADALAKGDTETYTRLLKVKKEMGQADDRPRVTVNTGMEAGGPDDIANAIMAGDQPPTTTGLYRYGAAVRAALAKKGFNLAQAESDWKATQKHLATLNSAQQVRMGQAIDNASHSLDVIEDLAKQWQGGRFPILNKGRLAAARQGALGPQAQQIATQLEAQIADVTSELGNVYMGGNSPTDHALGLASKNLQSNWSLPQLESAINLSRTNLRIRSNSMKNVGVAGASAGNPYAAPAPASDAGPVEEWVRGAGGTLVKKGAK